MKKILEICCYTPSAALIAEECGANRIELCDNYSEGGTTPSYAAIKLLTERLSIPVNVIVRPRGGDFLYSNLEYEMIKEDVNAIKELGANGIVIGFLKADGQIDIERTHEIINLASPLEVTLHRAFDVCRDPLEALDQLMKIGVHRILTSGAMSTAAEGVELIAKLVKKAKNTISIMPGSGITPENIEMLADKTGAKEFHSSAKTFVKSPMKYTNSQVPMSSNSSAQTCQNLTANGDRIRTMVKILRSFSDGSW